MRTPDAACLRPQAFSHNTPGAEQTPHLPNEVPGAGKPSAAHRRPRAHARTCVVATVPIADMGSKGEGLRGQRQHRSHRGERRMNVSGAPGDNSVQDEVQEWGSDKRSICARSCSSGRRGHAKLIKTTRVGCHRTCVPKIPIHSQFAPTMARLLPMSTSRGEVRTVFA